MEVGYFSAVNSGYSEPQNFEEAWNHPDPILREKWRNAIMKEIQDMLKRGVWKHGKKSEIPTDRRLIGSKWVFKIKNSGKFRAR